MAFFDDPETVDPPDGDHKARIIEADAFTGKDGREWAKVTLQLIDGGGVFDDFMGLTHPVGKRMARDQLSVYGIDIAAIGDIDDLALAMPELKGVVAEVTVSHDNGWVRVKAHNAKPEAQEQIPVDRTDLEPAPVADADIPF